LPMKRLLPLMVLSLVFPVLMAPVRLKDATPSFFEPPAQGPAPESYSLPAAEPLMEVTPTVIRVSPTLLMASPTEVSVTMPVTGTLNLPLPPSPTVVTPTVKIVAVPARDPNIMSDLQGALCLQALDLTQEMAMLSYQQKQSRNVMTLSLAASVAMKEVQGMQWPTMTAFRSAAGGIPMFQPQKTELRQAADAALGLCVNPSAGGKASLPRPD
jgi:hypothetical protein